MTTILILHLAATSFLCGLIWIVQRVHYPLFDRVSREEFADFEAAHQRRIASIVAPAMVFEALTAGAWCVVAWRADEMVASATVNAVLVVALWASTALLSVPQHTILARGFDAAAHRRLVRTNWVRTVIWTARTLGLIGLLVV